MDNKSTYIKYDDLNQKFPEKIKVSGFPFFLMGWNNIYKKLKIDDNGNPVYILEEYVLFSLVSIIGVSILKEGDKWILIRKDYYTYTTIYKKDEDQSDPFGNWTYGAKVEPYIPKKYWIF